MLVSRQQVHAKGRLQIAVSVKISHGIKIRAVIPVFIGSVGKIMLNISIPVIPKRLLKIRIFLLIFDDVYQPVHSPAL